MSLRRVPVRAILAAVAPAGAARGVCVTAPSFLCVYTNSELVNLLVTCSKNRSFHSGNRLSEWWRSVHSSSFLLNPPEPESKKKKVEVPGAEECDAAIQNYQNLQQRFAHIQVPSTYKTASQRVREFVGSIWYAITATVRFIIATPGYIWRIATMPRSEWSAKWKHVKEKVKEEGHHYWVGTKLLATDVKVASRLSWKALRGKELSRRERAQLTRTTADMFRLVPFIVILVIPFMELALPLLLKLFPNLLPSTYEDKLKKEEELKRRLTAKLEIARFLQDTISVMAKEMKSSRTGSAATTADELYKFMKRVRAGEQVDSLELVKFAQLFNDELTLDNLERVQLVTLCQFVGLAPYGTDGFLRNRLRHHLAKIKQDDRDIEGEGIENLTEGELRDACRARGMRAPFGAGAVPFMRRQLHDWLDLSLHRGMPSSLLLLSRAFTITAPVKDVEAKKQIQYKTLKEALGTLPEEVIEQVGYEAADATTGAKKLQKKLDQIQREEELIREEEEEEKELQKGAGGAAAELPPAPAMATTAAAAAAHAAGQMDAMQGVAAAAANAVVRDATVKTFMDVVQGLEGLSEEEKAERVAVAKQQRTNNVIAALAALASSSGVAKERAVFMDLVKKEISRLNEEHARDTSSMMFSSRGLEVPHVAQQQQELEDLVPKKLSSRVSKMLTRLEKELDAVDAQIGKKLHLLDLDGDGLISPEELQSAISFLREQLGEADLQAILTALSVPDGAKGQKIQVSELMTQLMSQAEGKAAAVAAAAPPAAAAAPEKEVVAIHTQ